MNKVVYMVLTCCLLLIPLAPTAASDGTDGPPPCLGYAYTTHHATQINTLLMNNTTAIGNLLNLRTDCQGVFSVWVDGVWRANFENGTMLMLNDTGLSSLEFRSDNDSFIIRDIRYSDGQQFLAFQKWEDERLGLGVLNISPADLDSRLAWVAFGTGLIVWVFVQFILWHAINFYVDRNYCAEVT